MVLLFAVDGLWQMYRGEGGSTYKSTLAYSEQGRVKNSHCFAYTINEWSLWDYSFFQCGWIIDEKIKCLVLWCFLITHRPLQMCYWKWFAATVLQIHHVCDVHVAVQKHNCHVPSFANVMAEPVSTTGQHWKSATTKVKTNANLKMENDI